MARTVGDGWPHGLSFITHPKPQTPVVTLVRATVPGCQATAPATVAEIMPAGSARIGPNRVHGSAARAEAPNPVSSRVFSTRFPMRTAAPPDLHQAPLIRTDRPATLVTPHPHDRPHRLLTPDRLVARLFVQHDLIR